MVRTDEAKAQAAGNDRAANSSPASGPWDIYEVAEARDRRAADGATGGRRAAVGRPARAQPRARHELVPAAGGLGGACRPTTGPPTGSASRSRSTWRARVGEPGDRSRNVDYRRARRADRRRSTCPEITVSDVEIGEQSVSLPRRPDRRAGAGQGQLLPELAGARRRGPVPGRPNLMVVVPTSNDVEPHLRALALDWFFYAAHARRHRPVLLLAPPRRRASTADAMRSVDARPADDRTPVGDDWSIRRSRRRSDRVDDRPRRRRADDPDDADADRTPDAAAAGRPPDREDAPAWRPAPIASRPSCHRCSTHRQGLRHPRHRARPAQRRGRPRARASGSPASSSRPAPTGWSSPATCARPARAASTAFADGADGAGSRRRRPRAGLDRPGVLRRRAASTRPARCSPPRTTRPSTTASSSAWRAPVRSVSTPVSPRSSAVAAGRARRAAAPPAAATCGTRTEQRPAQPLRRPRGVVRRPGRHRPDAGRRRHRQRHGRPGRAGGVRAAPGGRARGDVRRARRHVPEPSRRSAAAGEPARPAGPRRRRAASISASPSTATPTASSSSTRLGHGLSGSTTTALLAGAVLRTASRRHDPAQPDLLARPCPRWSASTAASRCAPRSATRSSSRSWPRPAPCSAASTRRTTTSPATTAPTAASSRR